MASSLSERKFCFRKYCVDLDKISRSVIKALLKRCQTSQKFLEIYDQEEPIYSLAVLYEVADRCWQ